MIGISSIVRALGFLLLASGLALPARAGSPARLDLEYHLYGLGIHAMTIRLRYTRRDDGYRSLVNARTDGIVETFYEYELHVDAKGSRDGAVLRPRRYITIGRGSEGGKRLKLKYADDGEITIETDETLATAELAARVQRGHRTIDPLSALLTLIETVAATGSCDAKIRVFDGKRRYDMTAADGDAKDGVECRVALEQIAGFRSREKDSPRYPKTMTIRLGRVAEGFPPMPVEVTASNFFGLLTLRLIDAKLTPAP